MTPTSQQLDIIEQQYLESISASVPDVDFPQARPLNDEVLLTAASDALESVIEMARDERIIHHPACSCATCLTLQNCKRVRRLIDERLGDD